MFRTVFAAAAAFVVGSAGAQSITLPGQSVDDVRTRLIASYARVNWQVDQETPSSVVLSREMQGGDQIKWRMILGNSLSTPARAEVRFLILKLDDGVQVTATAAASTQMASGQVHRQDVTADQRGLLQGTLDKLRDFYAARGPG